MRQRVLIALVGIVPACLTAILSAGIAYSQGKQHNTFAEAKTELIDRRLELKSGPNPNFKALSYPNYGLSLFAPVGWTIEDGPARLAGGEFNLVSRYEDTKGAIGMNFRLRPVQPNYINDPASQVANQLDVFRKSDADAAATDVSISGVSGKLFTYTQSTGKRRMALRVYWVRLAPNVQLQILCAQYTDAADTQEFWRNVDQVISSIVIAADSWQQRYKTSLT